MARVLLDTDILSEIIKKKDATVAAQATSYLADEERKSARPDCSAPMA